MMLATVAPNLARASSGMFWAGMGMTTTCVGATRGGITRPCARMRAKSGTGSTLMSYQVWSSRGQRPASLCCHA